jgi:D-3-phosphoglycerate dehydrogenase
MRLMSNMDNPALASTQLNVLLLENIQSTAADDFAQRGHYVARHQHALGEPALREQLAETHVLGIRSKTTVSRALLEAAPNLIAIGCFCIGTNQVDLKHAGARGVAVFNAPFSNTRSVAELTIAEIIALHRRLCDKNLAMHKGQWDKTAAHAHEVRGRTLGIVGYGHIGSQLSVLAEAIGLRVIYFDIANKLPLGNAAACRSLDELLARSDVVSLHVPETETTRGMIGPAQLGRMKRGAMLINNARGSVIDLLALRDALAAGHLDGAALDVFPAEPANAKGSFECPLAGLPNVILTPHVGGSTEEAQQGIASDVSAKLLRFIEDGSTASAVNVPPVDLPKLRPDQHRILHFHHNVPGVLSKMHRVLADLNVNINAEFLQSNATVSYVILDVDPIEGEAVKAGLSAIPETIRVRTLW